MLSMFVVLDGQGGGVPSRSDNPSNPLLLASFGDRVRGLRKGLGLSQEGLAEIAGLHRTYVGHVERGEVNPTLITILTLAKALRVEADSLVSGLQLDE